MMKSKQILVDNRQYEVIATVHDDDTNKDFAVYFDPQSSDRQNVKLSCVGYYEENGKYIPIKLTTLEEKELAKDIIMEVWEKFQYIIKGN